MKIISWNVNGIRASIGKGLEDFIKKESPDILCLQEIKALPAQVKFQNDFSEYFTYWNSAEKKGYSGTLIFAKEKPQNVYYEIGNENLKGEGRAITLEYPAFYMITNYTPNARDGLARIGYRLEWEEANRKYLSELDKKKPIVLCGDLNVAHNEIDLKNPDTNRGNAGFSDEERDAFSKLLSLGFTDVYRKLNPEKAAYTWWSYRMRARERDIGWRIDYFLVSDRIMQNVSDMYIRSDVKGSDHCPIELDINFTK